MAGVHPERASHPGAGNPQLTWRPSGSCALGRLAQVVVVRDSTVTAGDEVSIPIRIYDGNQSANRPVVIFYRGGGLTGWDLDTEDYAWQIDCATVVTSGVA
ncbi:hypothetical protein PABG_11909 [Paracoccidioides brasiliensis Pb03]|nr:hypothetical protein PABG_11909 [Paracoccidioides brasiliensis Pb03]